MPPVPASSALRVGIDIGGVFTHLVLQLPDGSLRVSKVPSTPNDPGRAVVEALAALLRAASVAPGDLVEIVHRTTVASTTPSRSSVAAGERERQPDTVTCNSRKAGSS